VYNNATLNAIAFAYNFDIRNLDVCSHPLPNINCTQLWRRSLTFAVPPNSIAKIGLVFIPLGETHTLACIPK